MTAADTELHSDLAGSGRASGRERAKTSQRVATAIAHELRNPVFAIASAAQLLRYRTSDDPLIERNIGRILREAERLNALVSALLDYGRPAPVLLSAADPDDVWTDVVAAQRGALESKALLLRHDMASPRARCELDVEQLAHAYTNVLVNAIEAAPEGSDLAIASTVTSDGAWRCRVHNEGPAVPANLLPHVFEPLVSSKPGHAGIGLAVAQRIVGEHGGTVALESSSEGGTTLTILLPAARG
jgi:signal transduction histidine kinase